jgi:hypothetical protein
MKHHTAVYDGALERDFCETVIRLFEDEQHKIESARYALARGDLSDTTVAVIDEDIARARRGRVVVCDNAPEWGRAKEEFTRSAERFMQIFCDGTPWRRFTFGKRIMILRFHAWKESMKLAGSTGTWTLGTSETIVSI